MLKILLKRQLYELNRSFFYDPKKGKSRSKFASAAFIVLYALLMVCVLGGMFAFCAYQLANPLRAAGLDWLYFALFGIIGLMFGVFGSVFNTYAALYKANDNDLLLSLPVPVGSILLSRLLGVYLMGLMFSAVVFVPALISPSARFWAAFSECCQSPSSFLFCPAHWVGWLQKSLPS